MINLLWSKVKFQEGEKFDFSQKVKSNRKRRVAVALFLYLGTMRGCQKRDKIKRPMGQGKNCGQKWDKTGLVKNALWARRDKKLP